MKYMRSTLRPSSMLPLEIVNNILDIAFSNILIKFDNSFRICVIEHVNPSVRYNPICMLTFSKDHFTVLILGTEYVNNNIRSKSAIYLLYLNGTSIQLF